ncbi:MFS transporter [Azotobacter vinelandii]|uniref:MFS transporter n=1 Tax=Azotobacter vinelandii TaxID=354 RepID=UPI0039F48FA0
MNPDQSLQSEARTKPFAAISPKVLIALIASLQFTYILDFMLVLPLGPDLAKGLNFHGNQVAWLTASYTFASLLSGLFTVPRLDRFDRRKALLWSLVGLALASLACTLAHDLPSLLLGRAVAGLCAAPAIATGMAILIDQTPPPQRGTAIAKVMTGFSIATIAGIPLALEVADHLGWQAPFVLVAVLVALVAFAVAHLLPPQTVHLRGPAGKPSLAMLSRPGVRLATLLQGLNQFSAFLVIPSFSAFYLLNLDYPRQQLGTLYLVGGLVALGAMQLAGRLGDRHGHWLPVGVASACFAVGLLPFFGLSALPLMLSFVLFMAGNAARTVCLAAAISHVPAPPERAGFMALQKMTQDFSVALAAGAAALVLGGGDGPLTHTGLLATLAIVGAGLVLWVLERLRRNLQPPA